MRRLIGFAGRQRVGKDTAWPVLMQHVIGCGEGKLVSLVVDYIYQSKE